MHFAFSQSSFSGPSPTPVEKINFAGAVAVVVTRSPNTQGRILPVFVAAQVGTCPRVDQRISDAGDFFSPTRHRPILIFKSAQTGRFPAVGGLWVGLSDKPIINSPSPNGISENPNYPAITWNF
ncbi:hypothetical protein M569_17535 [Genlisea aurea]|uniref:Uncharacterized protein n=1 Tax=Genlisea aurea TaxID=192259 RepID=S8BS78_9LAMI|nr:hypothetical protein M569_17535 [Genlisea aurea]